MATQRQKNYALRLLKDKGFSTRYMNARFKELGATMRERGGTVEGWIDGMNNAEASKLIDRLRELPDKT